MEKANYRKSRAPWGQFAPPSNNPYAHNNASKSSLESRTSTLAVPGMTRKQNRRASIHASAQAQAHGRSFSSAHGPNFDNAPPVPRMDGVGTILDRVSRELSTASAAEINEFNKVLQHEEQVVSQQIKTSINHNQKQILQLTSDLSAIQNELGTLRSHRKELWEALTDFRESAQRRLDIEQENTPTHLQVGGRGPRGGARQGLERRKDRSSVLVLQKMWATELQSLFKHVEGAAKYIEAIPGRHVLAESGRWHEVNVGTWKPVKPVHMFVLNDMVLMATKKQSSKDSKQKLQATHCWPLAQVHFSQIDVPGRDEKAYLINLKHKQWSYVYQTDRLDHFLKICDAFQKARDEAASRSAQTPDDGPKADARDEKRQLRQSVRMSAMYDPEVVAATLGSAQFAGQAPGTKAEGMLQNISTRVHQRNRSADFKKGHVGMVPAYNRYAPKNSSSNGSLFADLKMLEDRLDDVDVEVAHNQYDEAVGLVAHIDEQLDAVEDRNVDTENNEEVKLLVEVVRLKIEQRRQQVMQGLVFELENCTAELGEDEIERIIRFFAGFGELKKGVAHYLQAMSAHLHSIVSRLTVEVQGSTKIDVVNYLSNMVVIHVAIIKRVVVVHNRKIAPICAADPESGVDSSGLMNWAIEEMSKLDRAVRKSLEGTLVESVPTDDKPEYAVKEPQLFGEFISVLVPQLQTLKDAGVNADFQFEDILELGTSPAPVAPLRLQA
ncbi:exocyst complex component Exo84p [Diutina catenulata]